MKKLKKLFADFKKDPEKYLLILLVFSLPFERIPSLDVASITVRPSLIIAGILILRCLYLLYRRKLSLKLFTPQKILLIFLAWLILLIPEAINIKRALQVVVFNAFTLVTAISVGLVFQKKYIKPLLLSLFWSSALVTLFGLYQYFGDLLGLPSWLVGLRDRYTWEIFGFPRIQSTALEPLYFASYLMLPISALLVLLLQKKQAIFSGRWMFALLCFLSTGMFLTVSRGGILAIIIAAIFTTGIMVFLKQTSVKNVLKMVAAIVIGFVLAFGLITFINKPPSNLLFTKGKTGGQAFTSQLQNAGLEGGGDERAEARDNALMILKENKIAWVIGIGPGQYGPYMQHNQPAAYGWTIVNNLTLELLVETGLVGLGLIVIYFILVCVKLLQLLRTKIQPIETVFVLGLVTFFIAEAVQYQTFSTLYLMQIWVAAGLAMGYLMIKKSKAKR